MHSGCNYLPARLPVPARVKKVRVLWRHNYIDTNDLDAN